MINGFYFAGRSTMDFHMLVERYPVQKGAARKRTSVPVLGRNGNLHFDEGTFENYIQPYECGFCGERPTPEQAHEIKSWLSSSGASQRLEDSYDPDYYRLATFTGPMDIENKLNKIGKCVVTFDCDPRSFLKSGDQSIRFIAPGILHNPTDFPSKPLIKVRPALGTLTVGKTTVELKTPPAEDPSYGMQLIQTLYLDCEMQNAYVLNDDGTPINKNNCIYAPDFPELLPGDNAISWDGAITSVEIIPRWWTL